MDLQDQKKELVFLDLLRNSEIFLKWIKYIDWIKEKKGVIQKFISSKIVHIFPLWGRAGERVVAFSVKNDELD